MVSSLAESEYCTFLSNAKEGTTTRTILSEMGHQQSSTEFKTDNSTADGIINKTAEQKCSKAMDMRFYWIQDHKNTCPFYLNENSSPMIRYDSRLPVL
jgi:hypothetical protein